MRIGSILIQTWRDTGTTRGKGMKVSRNKTDYRCVNERESSGAVRLEGVEMVKVDECEY